MTFPSSSVSSLPVADDRGRHPMTTPSWLRSVTSKSAGTFGGRGGERG